jgi:hypothetical protein
MRIYIKSAIATLASMTLCAPAHSQVSVYIGITPPPIRYEAPPPPPPAPEFAWLEGFWVPQGRHYRWVPGHYERVPFAGAYWIHPHYVRYAEGWEYHEGYWGHEDHDRGHGHAYGHYKHEEGDRHDGEGDEHGNGHGHGHGHD